MVGAVPEPFVAGPPGGDRVVALALVESMLEVDLAQSADLHSGHLEHGDPLFGRVDEGRAVADHGQRFALDLVILQQSRSGNASSNTGRSSIMPPTVRDSEAGGGVAAGGTAGEDAPTEEGTFERVVAVDAAAAKAGDLASRVQAVEGLAGRVEGP